MANNLKTVLLLGLLTGIILFIGNLRGPNGLMIALVIMIIVNFASFFFSDKIALSMHHAQPVGREEAPQIYRILDFLCARSGIPAPKVYVIPDESPNAFATGRNPQHASVAVTQGALRLLSEEELTGVLAHELAHVKNRDILISSVAATLAGIIMFVARAAAFFGGGRDRDDEGGGGALGGLLMIIVAPIAAMLIQMGISRSREYQADASGAEAAGNPHGLASALQKLENYSKRIPMEASPSTAHMFIIHPFSGGSLMNLFSTHPPTAKRIERLLGRNN
jgi:heat shock protein HtpX